MHPTPTAPRPRPRRRRRFAFVILTLLAFALPLASGCQTVEFNERRNFARPGMQYDVDPAEAHFWEKFYTSREAGLGGYGAAAGGGCGCS